MLESYQYSERTWRMLAQRGVDWRQVDYVLRYSHPKVHRYFGETILFISAPDLADQWLMVTLSERLDEDDVYEIVDVRYLDDGTEPELKEEP